VAEWNVDRRRRHAPLFGGRIRRRLHHVRLPIVLLANVRLPNTRLLHIRLPHDFLVLNELHRLYADDFRVRRSIWTGWRL
jgi:hypothetical protein